MPNEAPVTLAPRPSPGRAACAVVVGEVALVAHPALRLAGVQVIALDVVPQLNFLVRFHPSLFGDAFAAVALGKTGFDNQLPGFGDADAVESVARNLTVADRYIVPEAQSDAVAKHGIAQPRAGDADMGDMNEVEVVVLAGSGRHRASIPQKSQLTTSSPSTPQM